MSSLYVIGGASGSGKTTVARAVARALDADWVQSDYIWRAILAAGRGSPAVAALDFDRPMRSAGTSIGALVEQLLAASALLLEPVLATVEFALAAAPVVVVDGAWLRPPDMPQLAALASNSSAIVLHEADGREVKRALDSRRTGPASQPWHARSAEFIWQYGNLLASLAAESGIPVVAARPRETLLERVWTALGLDGDPTRT